MAASDEASAEVMQSMGAMRQADFIDATILFRLLHFLCTMANCPQPYGDTP